MIINKVKAFTLVEMIVSITILSILGTIAYNSYIWHAQNSRDSIRLSDMNSIEKWLSVTKLRDWKYPLPDDYININSSWTILNYQGEIAKNTLNKIAITSWWIDPLLWDYYTYMTDINAVKYQILIYLESELAQLYNTTNTYASYVDKIPKLTWDKLWIFVDSVTKQPVNNLGSHIDIVNTSTWYTVYLDNSFQITWTWWELQALEAYKENQGAKNCKEILATNTWTLNQDWYYLVHSANDNIEKLYCDMTTSGWGWTLVWHWYPTESSFWITDNEKVSIWKNMSFWEIYTKYVNHNRTLQDSLTNNTTLTKNFIDYYIDLVNQPDGSAVSIQFDNWVWLSNPTWMFHGNGNCWRKFWWPTYTWCWTSEGLYIGQWARLQDGSWAWSIQPCDWNTTKNVWAGNSQCLYNLWPNVMDDTITESISWLTIKQWQESQVFVR